MVTTWQDELVDRLRTALPGDAVRPYGSVVSRELDVWSDLDVVLTTTSALDAQLLLGAELWAWQESVSEGRQVLRVVARDGRRVDLTVTGPALVLPDRPADDTVRFDAALAAVRLGRGNLLIGLHLVLGIGRATLVESMRIADAAAGTDHHPLPTPSDADAVAVAALASGSLGPATALRAYTLYGERRAVREPGYAPDASGLVALLGLARAT